MKMPERRTGSQPNAADTIAGCEHPGPAYPATRRRGSRADAGQGRSPAMV